MAAVRRPFEAHLFAYGQRSPSESQPSPSGPRRLSEDHAATEKLIAGSNVSACTHTRSTSNFTNADVETLDLNANSRPASIVQPSSPNRDRIEVFTSPFAPPPLPQAFLVPEDGSPSSHSQKTWPKPSSLSHQHRYSRSSVSLSRPHRLSSVTPAPHLECSSRSDTLNSSTGISDKDESPNSKSVGSGTDTRASGAARPARRRLFSHSRIVRPYPAQKNRAQ